MIYLGYNIRKLFSLFNGKLKTDYWIPAKSLQPDTTKKPSAKRLSKKAIKKSQKQPDEKAKKVIKINTKELNRRPINRSPIQEVLIQPLFISSKEAHEYQSSPQA